MEDQSHQENNSANKGTCCMKVIGTVPNGQTLKQQKVTLKFTNVNHAGASAHRTCYC